jgi:NAD/NADP transhydrogenase beta subunit
VAPATSYKAKTIIVNKRLMATGCAGLDDEPFNMDKTMMVFGVFAGPAVAR